MHLFTAAALTYAAPRTPSAFMQDDYLSFTSRHSLVGNGTRLAWVEKLRGTEKIFAVDLASTNPPIVIANYTDADGYSIGALTLDG